MQFTVDSKSLLSASALAEKCMKGKVLNAALGNLAFDLKADGKLSVSGTNLSTIGRSTVQTTEHLGEGRFLIEAKKLLPLLRTFSDQLLTFNVTQDERGSKTVLQSADGKYEIISVGGVAEYPEPQSVGKAHQASMNMGAFLYCMNAVSPLAFAENDSYELSPIMGVHVEIKGGKAEFAATDKTMCGYVSADISSEEEGGVVIPTSSANVIRTALKDNGGEVSLKWSDRFVAVCANDVEIVVRLNEKGGSYPNYRAVYPSDFIYAATINKGDFVAKSKRLMVCSGDIRPVIMMTLDGNEIMMEAADLDNGIMGRETLTPENIAWHIEDSPMKVCADMRQLLQLVENTMGNAFSFSVESPTRPLTISDTDEGGVNQIVMPLCID